MLGKIAPAQIPASHKIDSVNIKLVGMAGNGEGAEYMNANRISTT
jgi:hypothetical protein